MTPGEVNADGWCYAGLYPLRVLTLSIQGMRTVTYRPKLSVVKLVNRSSPITLLFLIPSQNIAQQQNGSVVIIEHRFYGLSNPINDLKAESLKYHTIQQAIEDLEYFIKNVILPQPDGDKLTPDKAPWVLFGGSYSGK